jgi:serine/threonine-protein kinase
MPLTPGTRIGPYEVTSIIGAGGMGEVYRALDSSLDRDVAIKILPEAFATDRERATRFTREAKTLASLNHQNIAHVHGIVELPRLPSEGGSHTIALVMEFVDGEDLAERLKLGAIPLDEAIPIAKQIADALECAHEQGIVHRDLKPANVKVRPDGAVKVLDFGLAKALSTQGDSSGPSSSMMLSPTFTSPAMTQLGIILGTAAYMAPEQARGKAVDKRADVWAFGVVLFEMLSGERAFEGSEVSDTLAFVLTREPDWDALPADTPAAIRRLLKRCLHKDRKQRLADISDARLDLEEAMAPIVVPRAEPIAAPPRKRWPFVAIPAALVAGILIGGPTALKLFAPPPPPAPITRFTVAPPDGVEFSNIGRHFIAISPDGSRIAYTAGAQIHVRPVGSLASTAIPGSAGIVINPVFSPDGESVAFYLDSTLRKLPVTGGTPFTLATGFVNPSGLHWSTAGIFAGQGPGGIVRVPEGGGKAEVVATVEPLELANSPQLLADGETLVFTVYKSTGPNRFDNGKIMAHSLRTGRRKVLYEGGADGLVVPTGHLIFGNSGVLYALKFDARTVSVSGTPTPILQGVRQAVPTGAMQARVADNGTLIYMKGAAGPSAAPRMLGFVDRGGKATPLAMTPSMFEAPRFSPDGTRLAVTLANDLDADIWIQDLPVKSALRRLTFGGRNRHPVWSPDGKQIVFQSNRDGADALYLQEADVSGAGARLFVKGESGVVIAPTSWSINGDIAVNISKGADASVHVVRPDAPKPVPLVVSTPGIRVRSAQFSPDGKWLAYQAGPDAAPPSVYVEPFPAMGAKYQIGEGSQPIWNPVWTKSGGQLLVNSRAPTFALFDIVTSPRFAYVEVARLSRGQMVGAGPSAGRMFEWSPDGKQLLGVLPSSVTEPATRDITVVLNWFEELKKLR